MTVVSTVSAIGMIPVWLAVGTPLIFVNRTFYVTSLGETVEEVPLSSLSLNVGRWLGSVAQSLALILIPVAIGVIIRWRNEKAAKIVEKVGYTSMFCCLLVL